MRSSISGGVKLPTLVKDASAPELTRKPGLRPSSSPAGDAALDIEGGGGGAGLARVGSAAGGLRVGSAAGGLRVRGGGGGGGAAGVAAPRPQSPKPPEARDVLVKFSPGDHGLTWDDDKRITGSIMQGWMRGVRPGWTVLEVGGRPVLTDEELSELLEARATGSGRYEVRFEKCQGNFGTEAKERQDQQKRNRVRLQKTFAVLAHIDKIEQRGVTLPQFQTALDYPQRYCEGWYDIAPAKISKTSGQYLNMEIFNFHHLNAWLISPATKPRKCAMMEMLASKLQPPEWFISHWWGEPVLSFVGSWQAQQATRELPADAAYWISAFAVRQHSPAQGDFTADPRKSGIARALDAARHRLLLIVDEGAVALSRLWCGFEASLILDKAEAALDIACSGGGGGGQAGVLTHGLTAEEERVEEARPGAGIRRKLAREAGFPTSLAKPATAFSWRRAESLLEVDRERILNAIAGRPLHVPLLRDHPIYEESSLRVRALLAGALWSLTASPELEPSAREKLSRALRSDVNRKSLELHLDGVGSSDFGLLVQSLPAGLKSLCLRLRASSLEDDDLLALAANLPEQLTTLGLDLSHCPSISDDGLRQFAQQVDFDAVAVNAVLAGTQVKKETQDWYAVQACKRQADGKEGMRREVARALGVNVCRSPQDCPRLHKNAVQAVPLLAQLLEDEENALRVHALRALDGWGDKVVLELDETVKRQIQDLRAERELRRAKRTGSKGRAGSKGKAPSEAALAAEPEEAAAGASTGKEGQQAEADFRED